MQRKDALRFCSSSSAPCSRSLVRLCWRLSNPSGASTAILMALTAAVACVQLREFIVAISLQAVNPNEQAQAPCGRYSLGHRDGFVCFGRHRPQRPLLVGRRLGADRWRTRIATIVWLDFILSITPLS